MAPDATVVGLGKPVALPEGQLNRTGSPAASDSTVTPVSFNPFHFSSARSSNSAQIIDQPIPSGPIMGTEPPLVDMQNKSALPGTDKPEVLKIAPRPIESIDQVPVESPGVVDGHCCTGPDCDCCDDCCCDDCCWWGCGFAPFRFLWGALFSGWECCTDEPCRVWYDAEYIHWRLRHAELPPLVTTSPPGTPLAAAGVLGLPTTTILIGGPAGPDSNERDGGRFTIGFWLNCERDLALESTSFFLDERRFTAALSSTGIPILARPFQVLNPPAGVVVPTQASELVAFPGLVSGTVVVTTKSSLWGTELNLRTVLLRNCCGRLDFLTGFRTLGLDESVGISEDLLANGTSIREADGFSTHNNFYGGQFGLNWNCRRGRWTLDVLGKVALGDTHESTNISGFTTRTIGGVSMTESGALLAQQSNIGHFTKDTFSVVPEVGVKLGYQITPRLKFTVGYTFLYWSQVARAADQIDTVVNVTQLPFSTTGLIGPARPAFFGRTQDFWAHGISVGLELKF
jgi:hypothetical protein